ncbi:hypothetical protein FIBSPDRAFT_822382 [Athelia psychrophila]|uniref:Uncharacterized protein n=1 Tax=Athelia psychrophila TaxID=1759441 RepID=A0A166MRV9_9AGAM|nr:hypothetical protein FIBSPDRAFT_822382 [Fibularhizoctonia sp. CBS 109695]
MVVLFLRKRRVNSSLNVPLISVSIAMFVLATIHIGVDLSRLLTALFHAQNVHGGTIGLLSQVNSVHYLLKSTAYTIQTIIGDGFLLYRLAKVWGNGRKILWPLLIPFAGSIACGTGTMVSFARVSSDDSVFVMQLHNWIISFFALTLFTNFIATFLIAFRIWRTHRRAGGLTIGRSLVPTIVLVIESGAIYSATLVILISLYLSGSYAQYIALDAVTQIIGVVFSLVIVRVGLGLTSDASTNQAELRSVQRSGIGRNSTYPLQSVAVTITQHVHDDLSLAEDNKGSFTYKSGLPYEGRED